MPEVPARHCLGRPRLRNRRRERALPAMPDGTGCNPIGDFPVRPRPALLAKLALSLLCQEVWLTPLFRRAYACR